MTRALAFSQIDVPRPRVLCWGEVLGALSPDELRAAYARRRDMLPNLVGDLYPRIILAEMAEIMERLT